MAQASVKVRLAGAAKEAALEFSGDIIFLSGAEHPFTVRELSFVSLDQMEVGDVMD